MDYEAKLQELFYKYYFDSMIHGEEEADKKTAALIQSGEYNDAILSMIKEGIKLSSEVMPKYEIVDDGSDKGDMH